ncbi:MAG: SRPBCC family protein [Planctomycetota bacterium]|nr:SRPBCC family protein [Planctomycetota bacterium]
MKTVETTRTTSAPLATAFETISDVRNFRKAVPHITNIEFLSEQQHGIGTRFNETRVMNGKEHTVELEVTEFAENESVRLVSIAGGTKWDTTFTVSEAQGSIEIKMVMLVEPQNMMARMTVPMILGMVRKGVEADMDSVKTYCENLDQE